MTKKALGKGLSAFLPDNFGILKDERFAEVDIEEVRPNPRQPRMKFDQEAIDQLAASIKETGVIQPLLVVPEEDHYRIIVGERRWRAAQRAGLRKIPVLVRNISHEKQLEVSLVENLHREDLNPLEIALSYQRLVQELNLTQEQVADKVGKDRTSVTNYLRLLNLPGEVQKYLADGKISMGHARALLSLENPELQSALARQVVEKQLSVRDVERIAPGLKKEGAPSRKKTPSVDILALQEELIRMFGSKVTVSGSLSKGVIKVFYFSGEDLSRIYDKIKGVKP
jgi:ParB family chromosome partitioning protein